MGDFYRSLDVFIGTSSGAQEGFFLPAIEAMACGVPTVLTDIPCFRSHGQGNDDDHYALFVPPKDAAALAEAIVVAGRMPDVRHALRRKGIELASRYTPDHHGQEFEAALQRFVDQAAQPTGGSLRLVTPTDAPEDSSPANDDSVAQILTQLVAEAEHASALSAHANAVRFFAAATCLSPEDLALQRQLAQAHQQSGDNAAAVAIYEQLVANDIDDEKLHLAHGSALHAMSRFEDAAQAFRAAIAVGTHTADALNRLGMVLFQAGDIGGARQSFERALVLEPDHADARANLDALPAA